MRRAVGPRARRGAAACDVGPVCPVSARSPRPVSWWKEPSRGGDRHDHRSHEEAARRGLGPSGWRPPGHPEHGPDTTGRRRRPEPGHGPKDQAGPRPRAGARARSGHGPRPRPGHKPGHGDGPTGEILFFAWTIDGTEPTSQEDIFGVDVATGTVRRLTDQSSGVPFISDRDASWSPDHSRIVFMSSDAIAPTHLPVLSATGAPVADLPVEGTTPIWVDAATVVCRGRTVGDRTARATATTSWPSTCASGIVRPLTAVAPGEHLGEPAWHASGGLAATFQREDPVTGEWSASSAGRGARRHRHCRARRWRATDGGVVHRCGTRGACGPPGPDWSPDGARIAFSATRPCAATHPDGTPVLQMDVALVTPPASGGSGGAGTIEWITDDTAGDYDTGLNDGSPGLLARRPVARLGPGPRGRLDADRDQAAWVTRPPHRAAG